MNDRPERNEGVIFATNRHTIQNHRDFKGPWGQFKGKFVRLDSLTQERIFTDADEFRDDKLIKARGYSANPDVFAVQYAFVTFHSKILIETNLRKRNQ